MCPHCRHVITQQPYIEQLVHALESEGLVPVPIFINGVEAHQIVRDQLTSASEQAAIAAGKQQRGSLRRDAAAVDAVVSTIGFPLVGGPAGALLLVPTTASIMPLFTSNHDLQDFFGLQQLQCEQAVSKHKCWVVACRHYGRRSASRHCEGHTVVEERAVHRCSTPSHPGMLACGAQRSTPSGRSVLPSALKSVHVTVRSWEQDMASWTRDGIAGLQSVVLYSLPELDGAIDTVPLGGLVGNDIFLVQVSMKAFLACMLPRQLPGKPHFAFGLLCSLTDTIPRSPARKVIAML